MPVQQSALEALADELGAVAGAIEREVRLRVEAVLADFARRDAERELRVVLLERRLEERLTSVKDGEPGASVTIDDVAPLIEAQVAARVAEIRVPQDGTSVTIEDVAPLIEAQVAARIAEIRVPQDGTSVTIDDVAPLIEAQVASRVAEIRVPQDGTSVTVEDVRPMLQQMVDAIERPQDGASVTLEDVTPLIEARVAEEVKARVADIRVPKDGTSVTVEDVLPLLREMVDAIEIPKGDPGAPGQLPAVKAWDDRVYYEGEVVAHDGGTWQASRDTGRAPPHEDWTCLARAGRDGVDGLSFSIEGTFDPQRVDYRRLSVVALNGGSFVAVRDNPGPCPGDGWQLLATRGKPGKPGEDSRVKGDPGPPGPTVKSMSISDDGVLTLANADGSTVELDLYPLLSKLQG